MRTLRRPSILRWDLVLAGLVLLAPHLLLLSWVAVRWSNRAEEAALAERIRRYQETRPDRETHSSAPIEGSFEERLRDVPVPGGLEAGNKWHDSPPEIADVVSGARAPGPRDELSATAQADLAWVENALRATHAEHGPRRQVSIFEIARIKAGDYVAWLVIDALAHDDYEGAASVCLDTVALVRDLRLSGGLTLLQAGQGIWGRAEPTCVRAFASMPAELRNGRSREALSRGRLDEAALPCGLIIRAPGWVPKRRHRDRPWRT